MTEVSMVLLSAVIPRLVLWDILGIRSGVVWRYLGCPTALTLKVCLPACLPVFLFLVELLGFHWIIFMKFDI
jgi:hypothetical protein